MLTYRTYQSVDTVFGFYLRHPRESDILQPARKLAILQLVTFPRKQGRPTFQGTIRPLPYECGTFESPPPKHFWS